MSRLTLRVALFYLMVILGLASLVTGLLLFFWPHGPRAGRIPLLGLTKGAWIDIHTYVSLLLIPVAVIHLLENRGCVSLYIRKTLGLVD